MPTDPSARPVLGRRSLLHVGLGAPVAIGALGLLGTAAGCSPRDLAEPGTPVAAPGDDGPDPRADAERSADLALVTSARRDVERRARTAATARGASALVSLHAAQLTALGATAPRARSGRRPAAASGSLRRGEETLGTSLAASARRANHGSVATLLAALAAGQAQRLRAEGWAAGPRPAPTPSGTADASPAPSPSPRTGADDAALIDALQDDLAGAHAALYLAGVLGARTTVDDPLRPRLLALLERHRARRDALTSRLLALGRRPVGPAAVYRLPSALRAAGSSPDGAVLRGVAAQIEQRTVGLALAVVAAAPRESRPEAIDEAVEAAVEAVDWGATPVALPGLRQTAR
ncbi:ferritin-like domain-containing protein [Nocardioides sp. TRM66260-LWL]|uniref:DUF4439 domain-containing protein n=1 Tax=Nocardioides sp. TRM66260-LWL TaxID=2874478 RepID=UPI001CC5FC5E|nr:DUF4439 domain-containing protein [Nocardioides sp. TRM66260-LWL]MBZ5734369.1 ferritin-like domain-containing protein [Nocardioides sp. TRM66260-LWL]